MDQQNSKPQSYESPWTEAPGKPVPRLRQDENFTPQKPRRGLLVGVIAAIAIVAGIAAFFLLQPKAQLQAQVTIPNPGTVLVGQPFVLGVQFSNISDGALNGASVSVTLPDGVSFLGQSADQRIMDVPVGDIGPSSVNTQNFNLIVTDGAESLKHIDARLSYGTADSRAEFEVAGSSDIAVGEPAVSLAFDAPQNVFSGTAFQITAHYTNNTNQDLKNLALTMQYPPMFAFASASITPTNQAKTLFNLGSLAKGQSGMLTLTGSVTGPDKSFFSVHGALAADFLGQSYGLNAQYASIGISATPLALAISAGNSDNYIPHAGDEIQYTLTYTNNSPVAMQNITITAHLTGALFDFSTFESDASLNSLTDTATWLSANTPDLVSLASGESKTINFKIKLLPVFPIRQAGDKNFTLKVDGTITSPTVPPGTTAPNTSAVASLATDVGGKIDIAAEALWRDAASGILNNGPYPPKVNAPTNYTIHWIIKNYSDDVANTRVSAYLQSGTQFTGIAKSNFGPAPTYDSATGLVTWNPGAIPATKGVASAPAEAIFQVQNTPAVNQAGSIIPLVGPVTVSAHDTFTNEDLSATADQVQTDLPDDKTVAGTDRRVQP